jgi:hypothetical protein
MVRKGSSVRVRQRALFFAWKRAGLPIRECAV